MFVISIFHACRWPHQIQLSLSFHTYAQRNLWHPEPWGTQTKARLTPSPLSQPRSSGRAPGPPRTEGAPRTTREERPNRPAAASTTSDSLCLSLPPGRAPPADTALSLSPPHPFRSRSERFQARQDAPPRTPPAEQTVQGSKVRLNTNCAPRSGRLGYAGRRETPPLTAGRTPSRWETTAHPPIRLLTTGCRLHIRRAERGGNLAAPVDGSCGWTARLWHRPPPRGLLLPLVGGGAAPPRSCAHGVKRWSAEGTERVGWRCGPRRCWLAAALSRCRTTVKMLYYSVLPALVWTMSPLFFILWFLLISFPMLSLLPGQVSFWSWS